MCIRDRAAQIACYLAINVGGTAGSLSAGLLVRGRDFRAAFLFAAAVLFVGYVLVFIGKSKLGLRSNRPAITVAASPIQKTLSPRYRTKIIVALTLAMMMYTISFGQVEGSLLLWAQDRTDRVLLGFEIPAAWFVGLPSLLVLLLAPIQLALLPRIQHLITTPRLVAWGLVAIALGFAILIPPALFSDGHRVSMLWLLSLIHISEPTRPY